MKRTIDEFTNLYSLSKTLRFELKPVGETAEKLEEFKNEGLKTIVEQDKNRAKDYKEIKKIIDSYHRYFIDEVLSGEILTADEIVEAYNLYSNATKPGAAKEKKEEYAKTQEKLRKKISERFSAESKKYHLYKGDFSKLINMQGSGKNKTKGKLWHWLKDRLDSGKITKEEFDQADEYIADFDKFTTYFAGFNQNRDNLYVDKDQSTAIAYRIVHENMAKHFENCKRINKIEMEERYSELSELLRSRKEIFKPAEFVKYLGQKGIDIYNEAIGHKADDINAKGINQIINEYRQKNNIKPRELPVMTTLYKQILSDRENGFVIDEFLSDKEVFEAIQEVNRSLVDSELVENIMNCLDEYMQAGSQVGMYIKNDLALTDISQKYFCDWSLIGRAINVYAEESLGLNLDKREALSKEDFYSIEFVQKTVDYYYDSINMPDQKKYLAEYFRGFSVDGKLLSDSFCEAYKEVEAVLKQEELNKDRRVPKDEKDKGGKGFQQIEKIKKYLDSVLAIQHFLKPLYMMKSGKMIELGEKNSDFYDRFNPLYESLSDIIGVYNKVRNYVTKKPYKTDKFKINFENSTLLDGWDVNKEIANNSVLLFKDNKYFLGVMKKDSNNMFNYRQEADDSKNKLEAKKAIEKKIIATESEEYYEKMVYKLLPDPSKMLPKVFFSKKNINYYSPTQEVLEIREKGLFKKAANDKKSMYKWIDFMKESLGSHPEWNQYFDFTFTKTKEFRDSSEFYKEVAEQGYSLTYDRIKKSYIDEHVAKGNLYLFEIYNKDMSPYSKGRPNLHTSYWKLLFAHENLNDLVIKLNGQAEVFFRPRSLKKKETAVHKANEAIENKNPLNAKKISRFNYDIIKDKRFTQDKFFFHCPITLNFKSGGFGKFNDKVIEFLRNNPDVCIIGIDRGERHLLYYTVINQKGVILEQGSFNTITSNMTSEGKKVPMTTDYHNLLDKKEKERDAARKSWSAVENIKELKSGYLSHVVHKLATLMVKHNAIVCLEDLNFGFKRGRFKFEKQVYQKFEKALIDKLNYLVFKDNKPEEAGHYLKAYQLTAPFESFQKLGKQSGFLFYVTSDYTSKIDPVTGFANRINTRYESVEKSCKLFEKFESIRYSPEKNYFEFVIDYSQLEGSGLEKWTICTHGKERYRYNREKQNYECYDVTSNLKDLFRSEQIEYTAGKDIRADILARKEKKYADFFRKLLFNVSLTVQLRHTYKVNSEEKDFILSPVAKNGKFFDSREYESIENSQLPINADANGAYNIARKGLLTLLKQINEGNKPSAIRNADWFDFVQKR